MFRSGFPSMTSRYVDNTSVLAAPGRCTQLPHKDADCADVVQALHSAASGLWVIESVARAALLAAASRRLRASAVIFPNFNGGSRGIRVLELRLFLMAAGVPNRQVIEKDRPSRASADMRLADRLATCPPVATQPAGPGTHTHGAQASDRP